MKNSRIYRIWLALLPFTLGLTACPGGKKSSPAAPQRTLIFVKGDPANLIAGATTNSQSPINEKNVAQWSEYSFVASTSFEEREEVTTGERNKAQIEEENKAATDGEGRISEEDASVKPIKDENGNWRLEFNGGSIIHLSRTEDGSLQPTRSTSINPAQDYPIEVLHWSQTLDGNFISFLYSSSGAKNGRSIGVFYFQKRGLATSVPTVDKKYNYLTGAGKKLGWSVLKDEAIEINLCGSPSRQREVKESLAEWTKVLENRLKVTFSQTQKFAPFSDLNQHCIYFTDTYFYEHQATAMAYGITLSPTSESHLKIIDGDILIFNSEFGKLRTLLTSWNYSSEYIQEQVDLKMRIALVHELGHLFGLDHKFDGTNSIMSYDFKVSTPQAYDIEAIQLLYPLTN